MINETTVAATEAPAKDYQQIQDDLVNLALHGLPAMYDEENQRFCFRMKLSGEELVKEGYDLIYTLICLLGLDRAEKNGYPVFLNVKDAVNARLNHLDEIRSIGQLGLLLRLCARAYPESLSMLESVFDLEKALDTYEDARHNKTMQLSWFLTGLSEAALSGPASIDLYRELAGKSFRRIIRNQSGKAAFGHMNNQTLSGKLRGKIGSFADQVYPSYALTKYHHAFGDQSALEIASACVNNFVQKQGALGQWWWHYDQQSGEVAGRYPVYSVHQDGMAPMVLFAVAEATGADYTSAICRGLDWLDHDNEMNQQMVDFQRNVIWRNQLPAKDKMYLEKGLSMLHLKNLKINQGDLSVTTECWSYHLGWVLYAFAGGHRLPARDFR